MEGNDKYEGFSVDLIDGISKMLGFKYIIRLVDDNAYGSYDKETKKWNGLVKELLDRVSSVSMIFGHTCPDDLIFVSSFVFQKADLAICDLTITYERRSAVDFTSPFMTLGTIMPNNNYCNFTRTQLLLVIYRNQHSLR